MKKIILLIGSFLFIVSDTHAFNADDYLKKIQIHGFASQGYLKSDRNNYFFAETEEGTFQFNEIGLNFIAKPIERLNLGIQFISRDLGKAGNNEIEIDWAFGDYQYRNWLGLRVGMLKVPHGLYNQSRDIDAARTSIFLPQSVYNESSRPFLVGMRGLGVYGLLPYGFSYQLLGGQIDDQKIIDNGEVQGREIRDVDLDYSYGAQILWETPFEGLTVGASITDLSGFSTSRDIVMGPPGTPAQNLTTDFDTMRWWVASLQYYFADFKFAAEYFQSDVELYMKLMDLTVSSVEQGYYGSLAYTFTDWLEIETYYSVYYPNKDDKDGNRFIESGEPKARAWSKDWALSLRFDINDYFLVKLEGHYIDGLAQETSSEVDSEDSAFLFAVKTTFSF